MTTMPDEITGGVDTHLDVHVAAALNAIGGLLGVESFPADGPGYRRLLAWLQSFGTVVMVGVEGTGSYGAGLTRHLHDKGLRVVEVDRPNRQERRRAGKSDPIDAVEAARAALSGRAKGQPKTRNGSVEAIRVLRVARCSARKERVRAINQLRSLVSTAPEELRAELRGLSISQLVHKTAGMRPNGRTDVLNANKLAMRTLAGGCATSTPRWPSSTPCCVPWCRRRRPISFPSTESGPTPPELSSSPPATTPSASATKRPSPTSAGCHRSTRHRASSSVTASTVVVTARPTLRSGASSSPAWRRTRERSATSSGGARRA